MDQSLSALPAPVRLESRDPSWETIAVGFLVEKAGRSGSRRTAEVYGRTVGRFLRGIADPATVTPLDVQGFAYAVDSEGRPPAPSTVCVRLAAVSGFYDFACRMEVMTRNPAARVRRPRPRPAPPRGLILEEVERLLAVIPDTPTGLLDRAITVTALLTGLRRSELVSLRLAGEGPPARYEVRAKGGGVRRRELPAPAWEAIVAARMAMGTSIEFDGRPVFPISDTTYYSHLCRYGQAAGLGPVSPHVLRHTAAKLRRGAGATIEDVCSLLGHRSIATTATYLRRLEDERDDGWSAVARALGLAGLDPGSSTTGDKTAAGSPARSRSNQESRRGGRCCDRLVTWRGAHVHAPPSRGDPTPTQGRGRGQTRGASGCRTRRRRAPHPRRTST